MPIYLTDKIYIKKITTSRVGTYYYLYISGGGDQNGTDQGRGDQNGENSSGQDQIIAKLIPTTDTPNSFFQTLQNIGGKNVRRKESESSDL